MRTIFTALTLGFFQRFSSLTTLCFCMVLGASSFVPVPAFAEGASRWGANLGTGRFFTNDFLGDGNDRWRSGAYTVSKLRGPSGLTTLPTQFGTLNELRFAAQIIAPANLGAPDPTDRPYVGMLSVGVHSHAVERGVEMRVGLDLVATGPSTGIGDFHSWVHDGLGTTPPSDAVLDRQIADHIYPTASFELARPYALGTKILGNVTLRPYVNAQGGVESFVRIGGDILIGAAFSHGVLLRDEVTGQLYQGLNTDPAKGMSFLLGADVAHMFDSQLLRASDGVTLTKTRTRARAGLKWQGERVGVFYGVTYLGREFEAPPEGQLVGSLSLKLDF